MALHFVISRPIYIMEAVVLGLERKKRVTIDSWAVVIYQKSWPLVTCAHSDHHCIQNVPIILGKKRCKIKKYINKKYKYYIYILVLFMLACARAGSLLLPSLVSCIAWNWNELVCVSLISHWTMTSFDLLVNIRVSIIYDRIPKHWVQIF